MSPSIRNVENTAYANPITGKSGGEVTAYGAEVVGEAVSEHEYEDSGSWAVTAP